MMLGLRMNEGVSEAAFMAMHGVALEACYGAKLRQLAAQGLVRHGAGRWMLTPRGMDIQNMVLVELMN
jgi:oxygen-independent coproporphyrinogen-3 oxidase